MADDPKKIREEIKKSADELAGQINESSKELKPKFQEMVKNLSEVNGPLAKSVAELRNTSKDTFAGALQAKKLSSLTTVVDKYLTKGRETLNEKELETLRKNFMDTADGAFNINDLKKLQDKIEGIETTFEGLLQTEESLISEREALLNRQLEGDTKLAEIENEIARQREIMARTSGAVQQRAAKKEQELLRQREEEASVVTSGIDSRIALVQAEREATQEQLAIEKETREEYNSKLTDVLSDATNFEGLEKFSDDLKQLTGLDIAGGLDNITSKVMSFVGVMKALGVGLTTAAVAIKGVIVKVAVAAASFVTSLLLGAASMLVAALPILGAVALIALAGYGIYKAGEYLWEKKDEFMEYISETWESIKMWISDLGEKVIGFFTMVSDYWMEKWDELTAWLGEDSDGVVGVIKDIINFVFDYFSTLIEGVEIFFTSLQEKSLVSAFEDLFDFMSEKVQGAIDYVRGLLPEWLGGGSPEEKDPQAEAEKMQKKDALASAEKSGLYDRNFFGASTVDFDKAKTASDEQLQAILDDDDLDVETQKKVEALLNDPALRMERALAKRQEILDQVESTREKNFAAVESTGERNFAAVKSAREENFAAVESTREKNFAAIESAREENQRNRQNVLSKALQSPNLEPGPRLRSDLDNDRGFDEYLVSDSPTLSETGNKIKSMSNEAAEAKESKMISNSSIQNVVGGTTVNNANTTKIMGRPSVWDDDRTLARVNSSEW